MKLKELKAMIAQQAIQTLIENKVSEASDIDTNIGGLSSKSKKRSARAQDIKTAIQQIGAKDVTPDPALSYHAKKLLKLHASDTKLPDNLRKAAQYISARMHFVSDPKLEQTPVNKESVIEHLIDFVVEPYSGNKDIKPYFNYLASEMQQASHEQSDEMASIDTISDLDDLDLVNVDPQSGEATLAGKTTVSPTADTVLQRKPQKIKETKRKTKKLNTKQIDDAIKNINSALKQ